MHAIKKPYLVSFDFGIFENYLIHTEMLHIECWLDSIWVRSPKHSPCLTAVVSPLLCPKAGKVPLFT